MKKVSYYSMAIILSGIILIACNKSQEIEIVHGVSKTIADHRTQSISNPEYKLHFSIPDSLHQTIEANMSVSLELNDLSHPLLLDFSAPPEYIKEVNANNNAGFEMQNGHLVIPISSLKKGLNRINIVFRAGETSLNRNKEFLYTLFVPDRASTAFPCFDQPNMKAKYTLELSIPKGWTAVSNAPANNTILDEKNARKTIFFDKTDKLSTYLFSFVAGKFEQITRNTDGRQMTMLHREPDSNLVARNVDEIFSLHAKALNWLEDYTQIKYPFKKFDFVAIPFFQYGGMEHAGAIQYRANSLFLEKNATQNQKLARAGLISHETAHMWFGDYVTMKWFDDVWLKEVFAGFMSDKIINPSFPEVNHDLKFLLSHYPAAYEIDRTLGANPIGQQLENMKDAGALYGNIIYHKAPIVMRHLESLMGAEKLRSGLQEYLKNYAFGDATWDQLIEILNKQTEFDLIKWSNIWVKEAGMPIIKTHIEIESNRIKTATISQSDPAGKNRVWPQQLEFELYYDNPEKNKVFDINFDALKVGLNQTTNMDVPLMITPNSKGNAYAYFELDETSKQYLLNNINSFKDPLKRGIAWITLWENMLNLNIDKTQLYQLQLNSLDVETNPLLIGKILAQTGTIYWQFFSKEERQEWTAKSEEKLWNLINSTNDPGLKKNYFDSYQDIALSAEALMKLFDIWEGKTAIKGLELSDNNKTVLAYILALKIPDQSKDILLKQLDRIKNEDRKDEIRFVMPSLSNVDKERDLFFQSLRSPINREHERWVVTSLNYLNHPLRAEYSIKYLKVSLELLQEIQLTGDIFFPKQWLDAVLGGYQSKKAADIVNEFLQDHPDYPENLKAKILQSADFVFRSQNLVQQK
ncbi:MAG: ERAP1-like C-terminal domain-containing protein [Bacteroidetes bacterium]|nr:ERAP1-like C-terminal domain-containing protein [Bacteroidota bacterium]